MKYSVIEIRNKQFFVREGERVYIPGVKVDPKDIKLLLISDGEKISLGKPNLDTDGLKITCSETFPRSEKVSVLKYKAKSRYRKRAGTRVLYSELQIVKLPAL